MDSFFGDTVKISVNRPKNAIKRPKKSKVKKMQVKFFAF